MDDLTDFGPGIRAAIDEAKSRMSVTHDADRKTLRVDGLSHGGWMVYTYEPTLEPVDLSANVRYSPLITGMETPPWWDINAAWEVVRANLNLLPLVPPAVHTLYASRVTAMVASYLAMKDRVEQWGGFTGERERLPHLLERLTPAERLTVDARLAGQVVR